ncbi:autotransporter outer membrane beta-barrel domain-containing protein [Phenylobacterium sp.]|uniref:autotransporter outer membrane beta-barrel domain-containing protein n=1 Tax=Phenylobacterium sp. TaxID=1871053 RepID=UPI0028127115|nr:autotransporter outer membrane beta-barrel domain-containing protein [Phenylobacterium sp.]
MKRLFVSAAVLPLLHVAGAHAETKISTATTTPVRTSTLANGQPDSLLIEANGSIKPTASGAAVTMDSAHDVKNSGAIGFTGVNNATGVLLVGGASGNLTNAGSIDLSEDYTPTDSDNDGDLDGAFAQGSGRFGIRATGPGVFTGAIRNESVINIEGNDSAGISLETGLVGSLTSSGAVTVLGDRSKGVAATSVTGDVRITGPVTVRGEGSTAVSLGDVGGGVVLQNNLTATGYRSNSRVADDTQRGKLDADDLKQGGATVRITGSVAKGLLLDRPPADASTDDKDEDDDGIEDALEATSNVVSYGGAPALDIGGAGATTFGQVGTGDRAFGIVNRGQIAADGVNDGVAAIAVRIGQTGGGTTTIAGGLHNDRQSISAKAYGAEATALLLNPGAVVQTIRNTGVIAGDQAGGKHSGRGIVDLSGSVSYVDNVGVIRGSVTPKTGETATARGVALDLSANTGGVYVRQGKLVSTDAPQIVGDVRLGSGADTVDLLAGVLVGDISFGAGADSFAIDGGAVAAGRLTDSDGRLAIDVRDGRLAVSNAEPIALTSLNVGAKGVIAVSIDQTAVTRFNVAGAATLATGAKVDVQLKSLVRGAQSYEIVRAQSLTVGDVGATLAGAPFLYQAALRADQTAGAVYVDVRPKTAAEIGLNRSGTQAFAAVFDSLDTNDAIEAAFLSQTDQDGFLNLYDQMLPDHSGGSIMSAAAISSAISSATAQPMAIDRESGMGVWAQEILFEIRRDRSDAAGFKSQGFGLAAGVDLLGEANALGLAGAFVATEYRDRGAAAGEQISMNVLNGGGYWRFNSGGLQATARAGLGFVWFDGDRRLLGSGLDLRSEADWTGWIVDAHAGASYTLEMGAFYARPEIGVDYLRLSEDGYTEEGGGDGFDLTVGKRKGDLLTGQAALALGFRFGDEIYWAPEVKVGWRHRLAGDPGKTTARFGSDNPFVLDPEQVFDGGLIARVGIRGGSDKVLFALDGGGTFEDEYREYDVRATVRFQF